MRINDNALGVVDRVSDVSKAKTTAATTEESGAASVKVDAASQDAAQRASQSTAARAQKVAEIAQYVRAGDYPIDLNQLAQAIAADELSRS